MWEKLDCVLDRDSFLTVDADKKDTKTMDEVFLSWRTVKFHQF